MNLTKAELDEATELLCINGTTYKVLPNIYQRLTRYYDILENYTDWHNLTKKLTKPVNNQPSELVDSHYIKRNLLSEESSQAIINSGSDYNNVSSLYPLKSNAISP